MQRLISLISIFLSPFFLLLPIQNLKMLARYKGFEVAYRIRQKMGGYYIGRNAKFASWPLFPHGYEGVYISGGASIGRACVIFQQVTIGSDSLSGSKSFGSPTLGDNCYIGAGAKIIGNVVIGDNCRVGANAVVFKDVPSNCTVVAGGGMRIIPHEKPMDNRFFNQGKGGWQYWDGQGFVPCRADESLSRIDYDLDGPSEEDSQ